MIRNLTSSSIAVWKSWALLFGLVALANTPNLMPWEKALYPTTYLIDLQERLLLCLPLSLLFFALFKRLHQAWLLAWLLCLWWMPISLAVRWLNDTPITSALLGIALESTPRELGELLQSLPLSFYFVFLGLNTIFGFVYAMLRRVTLWPISGKTRAATAMPGLLVVMLVAPWQGVVPLGQSSAGDTSSPAAVFGSEVQTGFVPSRWALAFPYEFGWALREHLRSQALVTQAIDNMKEATQRPPSRSDKTPHSVILVIGESASREDWHIFNPAAPQTTPKLDQRRARDPGLMLLTNVVSQSTATRLSVPGMLTDQPIFWPDGKGNPNATRSIVSIARSAGLRTAWYSNQTSGGKFDGPLAVYAKEAESVAFVNPSSYVQQGSYDEVLIPLLRRSAQSADSVFVVLHTLGSHFHFAHRYPPEFERFKPALGSFLSPEVTHSKQELAANAYRNSVLYTDYVLDSMIDVLEATGRSAALVYVSDHGQGIGFPGCDKESINRSMARTYEVPAFVWLSRSYRQDHPSAAKSLEQNRDTPYTTQAVYQTLLDLMEGRTANDVAARPSFVRGLPPESKQWVVSPHMQWVDFAEAARRNRCTITSSVPAAQTKPK